MLQVGKKKKKKRLQQVSSNGVIIFKLEENLMLKTLFSRSSTLPPTVGIYKSE